MNRVGKVGTRICYDHPTRCRGRRPWRYAAAFLAADLGLTVALIDPEPNPGGVCVYRGCIPSKALLHVAKVISEARHASAWGVQFGEPAIDLDKLREFKNNVVKRLTSGTGQLVKHRKVQYIRGHAELLGPHSLRVRRTGDPAAEHTQGDKAETLEFEHAILATGSRPAIPPAFKLDDARVMDSTAALDLPDVPASLLVVGGGYIGLELGSVYATLGSAVTVVEMTSGLLPGADRDLVDILARRVTETMKRVMLNTRVVEMKAEAKGIRVTFDGEGVKDGDKTEIFDRVLVSVGRRPNSRIPGSRAPASASTNGASSSSTSSCGPASRRSSRLATWSASRCSRTRRRTRGASPSR